MGWRTSGDTPAACKANIRGQHVKPLPTVWKALRAEASSHTDSPGTRHCRPSPTARLQHLREGRHAESVQRALPPALLFPSQGRLPLLLHPGVQRLQFLIRLQLLQSKRNEGWQRRASRLCWGD